MIPNDRLPSSQHTPVVANAGRRSVVLQVLGSNVTPGSVASASRISSVGGKTPVSQVKFCVLKRKVCFI